MDKCQNSILRQRYAEGLSEQTKNLPWSPTVSLLLQHISVRYFMPEERLPDGTLETLVAAAQSASTGSMLQTWSVLAVTDPERKNHVATLAGDQEFIRQAPLFLLFCIDLGRLADASAQHGCPGGGEGLERIDLFIMATLDAAMAAQNAAVAAESLGLGMCYAGAARNNARELTDYLHLPDRVVALFGMAVGKADPVHTNAAKPRLSMDTVLHREVWDDQQRQKGTIKFEQTLKAHYVRQNKEGRNPWTVSLANFVSSGDLDGRGRMRSVLDEQGFKFS